MIIRKLFFSVSLIVCSAPMVAMQTQGVNHEYYAKALMLDTMTDDDFIRRFDEEMQNSFKKLCEFAIADDVVRENLVGFFAPEQSPLHPLRIEILESNSTWINALSARACFTASEKLHKKAMNFFENNCNGYKVIPRPEFAFMHKALLDNAKQVRNIQPFVWPVPCSGYWSPETFWVHIKPCLQKKIKKHVGSRSDQGASGSTTEIKETIVSHQEHQSEAPQANQSLLQQMINDYSYSDQPQNSVAASSKPTFCEIVRRSAPKVHPRQQEVLAARAAKIEAESQRKKELREEAKKEREKKENWLKKIQDKESPEEQKKQELRPKKTAALQGASSSSVKKLVQGFDVLRLEEDKTSSEIEDQEAASMQHNVGGATSSVVVQQPSHNKNGVTQMKKSSSGSKKGKKGKKKGDSDSDNLDELVAQEKPRYDRQQEFIRLIQEINVAQKGSPQRTELCQTYIGKTHDFRHELTSEQKKMLAQVLNEISVNPFEIKTAQKDADIWLDALSLGQKNVLFNLGAHYFFDGKYDEAARYFAEAKKQGSQKLSYNDGFVPVEKLEAFNQVVSYVKNNDIGEDVHDFLLDTFLYIDKLLATKLLAAMYEDRSKHADDTTNDKYEDLEEALQCWKDVMECLDDEEIKKLPHYCSQKFMSNEVKRLSKECATLFEKRADQSAGEERKEFLKQALEYLTNMVQLINSEKNDNSLDEAVINEIRRLHLKINTY